MDTDGTRLRGSGVEPAWSNRIVDHGEEAPDQLLAHPSNWRTHPRGQQQALASVLGEVGLVQSVVVNRTTGHLIDGHLRAELAIASGQPTIPVVYVELSEAEEQIVLASLDPIGAMASADREKLADLLSGIENQDLSDLLEEIARANRIALGSGTAGLTDPDEIPEPPKEPITKRGDLWLLGEKYRVLCGDGTDAGDVERLLDGGRPRLLVVDPPYGVRLDMEWRDRAGHNALGPAEHSYMRKRSEASSISGDTVADWSAAYELVPSLEVAYVWHATAHMLAVAAGLERLGFDLRQQIVWVKPAFVMSRSAYHWQHEPLWYAVRRGATAGWIGDHSQSTVWEFASPKQVMAAKTEEKFGHPCQKPHECMARPIRNHQGDVYDPFLGSGTTLIAAQQAGRAFYGMEIEPRFVDIAVKRWENFTGGTAVLETGQTR